MKAIILAGGKGTRLHPLTKVVNKHLMLVYDRPMIMHGIEALREAGITDIVISLSYDTPQQFMELLGDGRELGVNLAYVIHGEPKGISYSIYHARNLLGREPFMCYLGDNIFGESLRPYVEKFKADPDNALILLKEVAREEAKNYGVAYLREGKLVGLIEKPGTPPSPYIMLGAYLLTSKFFDVYPSLKPSRRGEYEITDAINLLMPNVTHEIYEGVWFDCGTFDSILEASNYMKRTEKR